MRVGGGIGGLCCAYVCVWVKGSGSLKDNSNRLHHMGHEARREDRRGTDARQPLEAYLKTRLTAEHAHQHGYAYSHIAYHCTVYLIVEKKSLKYMSVNNLIKYVFVIM